MPIAYSAFTSRGNVLASSPARILLAEDDVEFRRWIADTLRADGYAVREAEDGQELVDALAISLEQAADAEDYDLVVSDVRMPGFSGIDVLVGLNRRDGRPPVILMTAFGDPDLHRLAASLGAVTVLDKPFDVDDLRMAVINTLSHPDG